MTLETLLTRAEINRWNAETWFRGAHLAGQILTIPDALNAQFVERNWLSVMCEHVPGLQIRIGSVDERPAWESLLNAKGRKAYRGKVIGPRQARLVE